MFVRKNLLQEGDIMRRNGLLKAIALFLLGASVVLLFSSADLILNPEVSNSFVYLQKMFLSPSGTKNTATSIMLDGENGVVEAKEVRVGNSIQLSGNAGFIEAEEVRVGEICDKNGSNCFSISEMKDLLSELEDVLDDLGQ